jgi:iron-sulfur cluster repair protein YtfE (RIC family)
MPSVDPAAPPEELNGFLLVHATLRKGGHDLLDATARYGDGGRDAAPLGRLWGFYARGLRQHHQGEDAVIFPLVAQRQPDFADIEAELAREHHTVDELLAAADAAVTRLVATPDAARARDAQQRLTELTQVLDAHLAHEERAAFPVVLTAIPAKEMAKIERGFLREAPRKDLSLALAALEATTKEHPELHLPPVPAPARLLLALVWRRQYARLRAEVDASAGQHRQ